MPDRTLRPVTPSTPERLAVITCAGKYSRQHDVERAVHLTGEDRAVLNALWSVMDSIAAVRAIREAAGA